MSNIHPAFEEENIYFNNTLFVIDKEIKKLKNELEKLHNDIEKLKETSKGIYSDELVVKTTLYKAKNRKLRFLLIANEKPYFGRIDFEELGNEKETYYIGKTSVTKEENDKRLVLDWRAPISGLYYSGELGEVMYNAPGGLMIGDLTLKRQYVIEDKKLLNVFDKGITPMDEYLQDALSEKKDNRLRDIVTTIQGEQNDIIRADEDKTIIVQGVAGSGKTTIVLHRIAYLLYTYQNKFKPEKILTIVPNKLFLNYISDVLPDLGVEDINQHTYEELIMKVLEKEYELTSSEDKLVKLLDFNKYSVEERGNINYISKFKGSLKFKEILDNFIDTFSKSYVPEASIVADGKVIFSVDEIKNLFYKELSYLPLKLRVDRLKNYINETKETKIEKYNNEIRNYYDVIIRKIKKSTINEEDLRIKLNEIYDKRDDELLTLSNSVKPAFNDYFKKWKVIDIEGMYKEIISDKDLLKQYSEDLHDYEIDLLINKSNYIFDKNTIEKEDLTPLAYLKMKLTGLNEIEKFSHIIVDEAQDYSEFEMYIIKSLNISDSFTIVGDLSQGIHSYKGTKSWDTFINDVFNKNYLEFLKLKKCYRSTIEIMDFANKIIQKLNNEKITLAEPVLRSGEKPSIIKKDNNVELYNDINNKINSLKEDGYKSIAIICKLSDEVYEAYNKLREFREDVDLISDKDINYEGGVVVIPSYLAKGLEFDAVIVNDCSENKYIQDDLHIKMLYVSATRALHKLYIYYIDKPSNLIKDLIE